jgi:vacuolar-type H+-ATPase subunit I/STV1
VQLERPVVFVKSDIRKITVALEKIFSSEVYLALGRAGIIHLARFQERDSVLDAGLQEEETRTREIIAGTEYALNALLISPEEDAVSMPAFDKNQDAAFVSRTKKIVERAVRLRKEIREKADAVARHLEYAAALNKMGIDPQAIKEMRWVKTAFGTVDNTLEDVPSNERFRLTTTDNYVFGLATPADYPVLTEFLKEHGFADKSADLSPVPQEFLQKHGETLRHRLEIVDKYICRLQEERGPRLQELRSTYRTSEEVLKAMHLSSFSARAVFITGWMDRRDKERLVAILHKICGDKFILSEYKDPHAPVRLLNMKLLKPFELLVKTMGMPSNSEIDPTPLTAVTFVLMFGLMFGDLGQGLVLLLGGMVLKRFGKKKVQEDLEQAGGILIACGGSAAVCGLLYGSVFSSEHIIQALWFHPTAHIMKLFTMTILMGVVFILAGLCVNILNSILNGDYVEALLEKRGLTVLILYAAVVFFALNYQRTGQPPALGQISVFIILPLILFSLRGMLGPVFFKIPKPHSITEYIIETVMGIVEIALSLFANTISFIRVGAFALSHAGLSIVTYTLADMADPTMKSAGAIIVIIIGNIFIIGFEGLICGIQSLRLEYYEFFSKFFKGDGIVFSPFTLRKASEV